MIRPDLGMLHGILLLRAFFCSILLVVNYQLASAGQTIHPLQTRARGVKVDLEYQSLVATLYYGDQLARRGNNPQTLWHNLEDRIRNDAASRTFGTDEASERYDLWPRASFADHIEPQEPSYMVRFSLVKGSSKCYANPIDKNILNAVSRLFYFLGSLETKPDFAFAGNITNGRETLYQFRLYDTGVRPARPEKKRNLASSDLEILNRGRDIILSQTTTKDIIVFLGSSGSYFYYAMNRPDDPRSSRRNTFLLPLSGAHSWSEQARLDQIRDKSEYHKFVRDLLTPIFRTKPCFGRCRFILVDYTRNGNGVLSMRAMLIQNSLWYDNVYYINIESPNDPHGAPDLPRLKKMTPISIESWPDTELISDGGFGRIVPPYPWFYWDVPPASVDYPEKAMSYALIDQIRNNYIASTEPSSGQVVARSNTGNNHDKTTAIFGIGHSNMSMTFKNANVTFSSDEEDADGYNQVAGSVPNLPSLNLGPCAVNSTSDEGNVTKPQNLSLAFSPVNSESYPSEIQSADMTS